MKNNKHAIGMKFGEWEVIDWISSPKGIRWICKCKCGKISEHKVWDIESGKSHMCEWCSNEKSRNRRFEEMRRIAENKKKINDERAEKLFEKALAENERIKKLKEYQESFVGNRYGNLEVIEAVGDSYICRCDCGGEYIGKGKYIRSGCFKSCGCIAKEIHNNAIAGTRIYGVWSSMIDRCYNQNSSNYKNYGGREIIVCDEWRDARNFVDWAMNSGYDENALRGECTIERIDNDGPYSPKNCRWANMQEQARNRRKPIGRKSKTYPIYGKELTMRQITERYGISAPCFAYRLKKGWLNEQIVETPMHKTPNI